MTTTLGPRSASRRDLQSPRPHHQANEVLYLQESNKCCVPPPTATPHQAIPQIPVAPCDIGAYHAVSPLPIELPLENNVQESPQPPELIHWSETPKSKSIRRYREGCT